MEGGRISLYSEIRRKEGFKVKFLPSTLSYSPEAKYFKHHPSYIKHAIVFAHNTIDVGQEGWYFWWKNALKYSI